MKKLKISLSLLIILVNFSVSFSQKTKENTPTSATSASQGTGNDYTTKDKIFRTALKYGDLIVAKQALYEMIVLKPEEKSLKDSLAFIYINLGSLKEAIIISREILESDPDNLNILEVKAVAEQNLGLSKESLASYESLYVKSKNVYHLYQISTLQYELKRISECNSSLDQILATPDVEKKEINMGTGVRGQQQRVILKAAALNVKGVLAMDLKENNIAQKSFEEALRLSPDFELAKANLEYIKKGKIEPKPIQKPSGTTKSK